MDIHMKLQKLVDHLDAEYERRLRFLTQKLLNEHVIMDDIEGDFSNRFRYGIASTADAALASLAREAELWIREWAERSEVKLSPEHIQVYAELNQTCSNYLFWPNGWDGDYELEFGNGKELS